MQTSLKFCNFADLYLCQFPKYHLFLWCFFSSDDGFLLTEVLISKVEGEGDGEGEGEGRKGKGKGKKPVEWYISKLAQI